MGFASIVRTRISLNTGTSLNAKSEFWSWAQRFLRARRSTNYHRASGRRRLSRPRQPQAGTESAVPLYIGIQVIRTHASAVSFYLWPESAAVRWKAAGSNRGIKEDQEGDSRVQLIAHEPPRDLAVRRGKTVYGCAAAWQRPTTRMASTPAYTFTYTYTYMCTYTYTDTNSNPYDDLATIFNNIERTSIATS